MTILVIEDSKLLRIGNSRALVKAGYQVIGAVDGEEGLRMARESIPDLILLDMLLPKITGLDVLKDLKSDVRTRNIPVIVMSGLSHANEAKLVKEGAAAFFEKSEKLLENDSADLVAAVKHVLANVDGKAGSEPPHPASKAKSAGRGIALIERFETHE